MIIAMLSIVFITIFIILIGEVCLLLHSHVVSYSRLLTVTILLRLVSATSCAACLASHVLLALLAELFLQISHTLAELANLAILVV